MMKFALRIFALTLLWVLTTNCQTQKTSNQKHDTQNADKSSSPEKKEMEKDIRVIENTVQSSNFRRIALLVASTNFKVEYLSSVFKNLSEKYPNPKYLTIEVSTDVSQLPNPSNGTGSGSSRVPLNTDRERFPRAIYYRRGKNVFFRYSMGDGKGKYSTVVLKGEAL